MRAVDGGLGGERVLSGVVAAVIQTRKETGIVEGSLPSGMAWVMLTGGCLDTRLLPVILL